MTEIKLRDYQRDAIDAVFTAWSEGMKAPAIVLPTGAGKTVVFASLIREFREQQSQPLRAASFEHGNRVMVLAHRDELVDQAIAKIRAVLPKDVSVGKVKAEDNEIYADVMVCSVQTLASARRRQALYDAQHPHGDVGLIITDECHHAAAASYRKVSDAFPDALRLGVTATMARGDGVGLGDVWDDVVFRRSPLWMISRGYLTDVRTKQVDLSALDLGAVKASRGDWQAGALGEALMDAQADQAIARAWKEHAGDRQGIVFTPTVETAYAACDAMDRAGVISEVVSGETPRDERQKLYEDFRRGHIKALINCMVLTEGFDAPWAEVAMIARPTQSAPLYMQMVGRVLRPWPGKTEALVLDLVGASAHKLRTLVDLEPGTVQQVRNGESLAEAALREEEEQNRKVAAGSVAFELRVREVSSFGSSDYAWVRTPRGVMFLNCGQLRVFLWPSAAEGAWDVCLAAPRQQWHRTEYQGLELSEAMLWAEAVSDEHAGFGTAKTAAWRRKAPSEKQLALASSLGLAVPQGARQGDVSYLIDVEMGARIFDQYAK